jgi:hypothetical protein
MRNSKFILFLLILSYFKLSCQITNYVSNGSFEECVNCDSLPYIGLPKYWTSIDSVKYSYMYCGTNPPISNLPYFGNGYQFPRSGDFAIVSSVYCQTNNCTYTQSRGYPRNRLKGKLILNEVYCVKYYVNNRNTNTVAIDAFGAYFGNEDIDTIKYCSLPLTYLSPQIQNQTGNIISDTLGWRLITGTFVANGTEKYVVLGNFKSNASTNTLALNPAELPYLYTDVFFDDVSVIAINLSAFAGRDTVIFEGDSVYLGRESDVGIDEACIWYKLTSPTTSVTVDTIAGFWIKPNVTSTYIVKQEICGFVKWDTVKIYMDAVGLEKLKVISEELKLFPVPAKDELQLSILNADLILEFHSLSIFNNLGLLIREEELKFETGSLKINTEYLPNGVYFLQMKNNSNETLSKRFVISR